jgi:hypothetical protein
VALHKREEVCNLEPCLLKKCPRNICLEAITVAEVFDSIKTWWEPLWLGQKSEKADKSNPGLKEN